MVFFIQQERLPVGRRSWSEIIDLVFRDAGGICLSLRPALSASSVLKDFSADLPESASSRQIRTIFDPTSFAYPL